MLATLSVAVTLASAPVDNFWHVAFGRDAVIWSPPHLLGIVGTGSLAVALLVELSTSRSAWARPARWLAGGSVLSAFAFLTIEYDTDVPQFDRLWHLPVLCLASSFALLLVRRVTDDRWAATKASVVHLGFLVVLSGFLAVEDFSTPRIPLLVVPAFVLDVTRAWRSPILRAGAFVAALFAVYVAAAAIVWSGQEFTAKDVAIGAPMAWLAVVGMMLAVDGDAYGRPRRRRRGRSALAVLLLVAAFPGRAGAHDPGQGPAAGSIGLLARVIDGEVRIRASSENGALTPRRLLARRAGEERLGTLKRSGAGLAGEIRLPASGRWFVYLEMLRHGREAEAWLPINVSGRPQPVAVGHRFVYYTDRKPATAGKYVAGGVLYALVIAFLTALVGMVRRLRGDEPGNG